MSCKLSLLSVREWQSNPLCSQYCNKAMSASNPSFGLDSLFPGFQCHCGFSPVPQRPGLCFGNECLTSPYLPCNSGLQ